MGFIRDVCPRPARSWCEGSPIRVPSPLVTTRSTQIRRSTQKDFATTPSAIAVDRAKIKKKQLHRRSRLCTVTLAITPLGRREAEDGGLGPLRVSGGKVWCTALKPYGRVFVLTQRLLPVCCARETASRGGLHGCGRRPIAQHRVARHVPPLARPQREVLRAVKGRSGEQRSELL